MDHRMSLFDTIGALIGKTEGASTRRRSVA